MLALVPSPSQRLSILEALIDCGHTDVLVLLLSGFVAQPDWAQQSQVLALHGLLPGAASELSETPFGHEVVSCGGAERLQQ